MDSPMTPTKEPDAPRPRPEAGQAHDHRGRPDEPDGGWPGGTPYTVYFPDGDEMRGADLEHGAPLPRVGDTVEYVDETGASHRFVVKEVIHTLQTSARSRPSVHEGEASPDALARPGGESEIPGGSGSVRAGLPKVILERQA
jgi:hypothetical protein